MPFEELEEKEMARKNMIRPLIQELRDRKRIEGETLTCMIEEITDDQKTPWYLRIIPCLGSTPRQKVMKQKKTEKV